MAPRVRLVLLNLLDLFLIHLAAAAALLLRFDGHVPRQFIQGYVELSYFSTLAVACALNLYKVHRTLWRYAGTRHALSVVSALTLAYGAIYALNLALRPQSLPRSVVILNWLLAILLLLGVRMAWRIVRHPLRRTDHSGRRIVIVGAGDIGAMVAREIEQSVSYPGQPVGFIDDDPRKRGASIENLEVLGTTFDLPGLLKEMQIGEVIIAAPSATNRLIRQVVRVCFEAGVTCRTVPALADYIEGKGALDQVREIRIEDLLGRDPIEIDLPGIRQSLEGRTILVTGAGGSIGSELCRQISRFRPGRLILLDHNENTLTYLALELREAHPDLLFLPLVADVKDEAGTHHVFEMERPEIVFHAAAHKHVNLLEVSPREAILNNVLGTRNVARACDACGVSTLVLISTDKAVNPTSVMGASKRVCEVLLQSMAHGADTTMVAVRFGNVIGSEGSVLPIFRRQLERGGPLTVTHPEARRFFMTIPEASQLVIQSALLGSSGDVFILDMGEQVRIVDVARQLIRLNGLEPDRDVRIDFIGLRPGEKLEEELLTRTETARTTRHAKIYRCDLEEVNAARILQEVDDLIRLSLHGSPGEIRAKLRRIVPEYHDAVLSPLPVGEDRGRESGEGFGVPMQSEPPGKRTIDAVLSAAALLAFAVPSALAWLLVLVAGPARVAVQRQERIGVNRRSFDRRAYPVRVAIDRRNHDRRRRSLPGRAFVTRRFDFAPSTPAKSPGRIQRKLAAWLVAARLDRVLYFWNVLRGEMSLVGPSAHLAASETWKQESISAWCFARRPGLTGPAQVLRRADGRSIEYDRYYGSHGNWRLDLDAIRRSLPRVFVIRRQTEEAEERDAVPTSRAGEGGMS